MARAKVEREGICRVCGRAPGQGGVMKLEAAHILGREHDAPTNKPGFDLWVNPNDVVPLCVRIDGGCHGKYDRRSPTEDGRPLDLLPHLTRTEEVRAVELVGIEAARRRTTGERA